MNVPGALADQLNDSPTPIPGEFQAPPSAVVVWVPEETDQRTVSPTRTVISAGTKLKFSIATWTVSASLVVVVVVVDVVDGSVVLVVVLDVEVDVVVVELVVVVVDGAVVVDGEVVVVDGVDGSVVLVVVLDVDVEVDVVDVDEDVVVAMESSRASSGEPAEEEPEEQDINVVASAAITSQRDG